MIYFENLVKKFPVSCRVWKILCFDQNIQPAAPHPKPSHTTTFRAIKLLL